MMRIAMLGDIHANLPALEAVLDHARQQGAQTLWNIGDFIGYGAYPDEVVQRMRQERAVSIAGNYDLKVLRFPKKEKKWKHSKHPYKYLAFQWAYQNLSIDSRQYLSSLPKEIRLQAAGKQVLLTHGSPQSNEEHLTPDTPVRRFQELAGIVRADIVVFGHSHRPFAKLVEQIWFINTGSVGRPDDGDPRAAYAILHIDGGAVEVHHFRVEYDVARAAAAIRERGLPDAFAQMILSGYDLETILRSQA